MKRLLIAGLILASFQTQAVVVAVAATNAAVAAQSAAQNAQRQAQNASSQAQQIDFPKTAEPEMQYGFVTCGKRNGEAVSSTGCVVYADDDKYIVTYKDWPRKILGIEKYTVNGVQFDHYNGVATIYFEYR